MMIKTWHYTMPRVDEIWFVTVGSDDLELSFQADCHIDHGVDVEWVFDMITEGIDIELVVIEI